MRIGVDARAAAEVRGGRGTVVRQLITRLGATGHDVIAFAREPWGDVNVDWELIGARDPLWNLAAARRANAICDAFISMDSYLTAWFLRVPTVLVVNDLVAFARRYEPHRATSLIERTTLPLAIRRADVITTISRATADDLIARFPRAREKTAVVLLAADERFFAPGPAHRRERPYVLAVGTLEPRKNLPRLIEAFAALPTELRDGHELVLVGGSGWQDDDTLAAIGRHSFVSTTGHVDDDLLPQIYRGATLFAYPSLYEGFGLPVVEAMAAGVPVLTSDVSSLPEVAGEAAVYVDPRDVRSITDGLARALGDAELRARLARAGRERAASFSWDRYAAAMADAAGTAVARRNS